LREEREIGLKQCAVTIEVEGAKGKKGSWIQSKWINVI
jgi:hypothetical protein